jgi:hypothetical protein
MTDDAKRQIQKFAITVLIFFIFAGTLVTLQLFTAKTTERAIAESAGKVLAAWSKAPPTVGDRIRIVKGGLSSVWIFASPAKGKGRGLVFVTPITGNEGPFTGVFYYTQKTGTVFCGLAGIDGTNTDAARHGITTRILDSRLRQLDLLAARAAAGDAQ